MTTEYDESLEKPQGEPEPCLYEGRIWVDGCFDFFHHGHAGAIVQSRRLGDELYCGVHSDEAILKNKGPSVMNLAERQAAMDACRWVTKTIPYAPYVTDIDYITHYGCKYVAHGDDITSDSDGNDTYRFVKEAGRFKVVKRSPGISTTDLVGRMLLCTRTHFIKSLERVLAGEEGSGTAEERRARGQAMLERIRLFATDETAERPGVDVWFWGEAGWEAGSETGRARGASTGTGTGSGDERQTGVFRKFLDGKGVRPGQRVVYVDGGFDLFCSGHIEFLRRVLEAEEEQARSGGWYTAEAQAARALACSTAGGEGERDGISGGGGDYGPAYVVVGVHEDGVINAWKGLNYPVMNMYERGLCVLQCRYIDAVVLGAPFTPSRAYLSAVPVGSPAAVYHGPTAFMPLTYDPYAEARAMGIYREIGAHAFSHVNAGQIVGRILQSRDRYEERQRAKGVKAEREAAAREREMEEGEGMQ